MTFVETLQELLTELREEQTLTPSRQRAIVLTELEKLIALATYFSI